VVLRGVIQLVTIGREDDMPIIIKQKYKINMIPLHSSTAFQKRESEFFSRYSLPYTIN